MSGTSGGAEDDCDYNNVLAKEFGSHVVIIPLLLNTKEGRPTHAQIVNVANNLVKKGFVLAKLSLRVLKSSIC